jgi:hypothetical protein
MTTIPGHISHRGTRGLFASEVELSQKSNVDKFARTANDYLDRAFGSELAMATSAFPSL